MSEMLGNHHFLTGKYNSACDEFEAELIKNPQNSSLRKKLVICYLETGNVRRALKTFYSLIAKDINSWSQTDPASGDCPCHQILMESLQNSDSEKNFFAIHIKQAILEFSTNLNNSIKNFEEALKTNPSNDAVKNILMELYKSTNNT